MQPFPRSWVEKKPPRHKGTKKKADADRPRGHHRSRVFLVNLPRPRRSECGYLRNRRESLRAPPVAVTKDEV